MGIVNASGEAMGNVARYSALLAGLPPSVAGVSMNRFCGSGLAALNAVVAIRRLLDWTGVGLDEVGLIKINEAFAAQMVACIRELGLDEAQ